MASQQHFHYKITYDEAYETFLLCAFRYGKRKRMAFGIGLSVLSVLLLVAYFLSGSAIYYLYLAFLSATMLLYIAFFPMFRARRGATSVERAGGEISLSINAEGVFSFDNGSQVRYGEDKYSRFFETEKLFAIRADGRHTICIPKRVLSLEQIEDLRKILAAASVA